MLPQITINAQTVVFTDVSNAGTKREGKRRPSRYHADAEGHPIICSQCCSPIPWTHGQNYDCKDDYATYWCDACLKELSHER
jgi:hypothetical protein